MRHEGGGNDCQHRQQDVKGQEAVACSRSKAVWQARIRQQEMAYLLAPLTPGPPARPPPLSHTHTHTHHSMHTRMAAYLRAMHTRTAAYLRAMHTRTAAYLRAIHTHTAAYLRAIAKGSLRQSSPVMKRKVLSSAGGLRRKKARKLRACTGGCACTV